MAGGELAAQMGVELRVIRVGSNVLPTFGVSDVCVRKSERSHGLGGSAAGGGDGLARSCGMQFVILFADDGQAVRQERVGARCEPLFLGENR